MPQGYFGTFDEGDFFGRKSVQFIDELVDLLVGGADGIPSDGALESLVSREASEYA